LHVRLSIDGPQIYNSVVGSVAIDVVNIPLWPPAVVKRVGDSMRYDPVAKSITASVSVMECS